MNGVQLLMQRDICDELTIIAAAKLMPDTHRDTLK